jgi:hypothetical protein
MKSASEYWKERFGEEPKSDNDKLMCAMMREYSEHYQTEMQSYSDHLEKEKAEALDSRDAWFKKYGEKMVETSKHLSKIEELRERIEELEKVESKVYSDVYSAWCSLDNDDFDEWLYKRIRR